MQRKSELSEMVTKYVNHKVILFKSSKNYQKPERAKSVTRCTELVKWLNNNEYKTDLKISQMVMLNQAHLMAILPFSGNKSYESSLDTYNSILVICKDNIEFAKFKQASA